MFLLILSYFFWAGQASAQISVWGDNTYGQTNVPPVGSNVIALAAGDYHCLALRADGTVAAWGDNSFGQTNVPFDLTNAVSIAAGSMSSLALRSDGTVAIWGTIEPTDVSNAPPNVTNVVALAAGPGAQHALVLRGDGTVVDWGNPSYGLTSIPPMAQNIVNVAAGNFFAVAVRADGTVVTWGNGPSVPSYATNIVAVATGWNGVAALRADGKVLAWNFGFNIPPGTDGFTNVVDLACPFNSVGSPGLWDGSVIALRRNGTMVEGPSMEPGTLHAVPAGATNIGTVAAGSYDALAAVGTGIPVFPGMPINRTVDCGLNAYFWMNAVGALPVGYQWSCNGTNIPGAANPILTVTNVQPLQAGNYYTLTATNKWGTNTSGKMTLNVTPLEAFIQPQMVSTVFDGTITFTAGTVGLGPFSYQWQFNGTNLLGATNSSLVLTNALASNEGTYSVVVSNLFGEITNFAWLDLAPTIVTSVPQSQTIPLNGTVTLSIGVEALIPVSYQWQFNGNVISGAVSNSLTVTNATNGQGGVYTVIYSDAYEAVTNSATLSVVEVAAWGDPGQSSIPPGLTNLLAVACGEEHGLGLNTDRTVTGWGGSLATPPAGLTNVAAIAAGNNDSLALCNDGTVVAWGLDDSGQANVPAGLTDVVAIAAGDFHNLALRSDGTIVAWGDDEFGQIDVPIGLTNVVAIAAGEWNSMALKADGTVMAWGAGTNDPDSNPNFGQSIVPANLSNVVQIATGGLDDLAFRADGSLVGWGANDSGEDSLPAGLSNIVTIAAGYGFSVALKADGTVTVWGDNEYSETVVPAGLTNVTSVSAMGFHTLALIANGPPPSQVPIVNAQLTSAGFSLSLPTQSGRVYRLEFKNSLSDSNWTASPLAAGNGGIITFNDSGATNYSQRFYRIRQW